MLPIVSYAPDGAPLAWNESAKLLFAGAPPRLASSDAGFRSMHATLLRAGGPGTGLSALRTLLDSCAQPALLFDLEGQFVAANPAAAMTLGWADTLWSGRSIGPVAAGSHEALEIQNVLIMQGRWTTGNLSATASNSGQSAR